MRENEFCVRKTVNNRRDVPSPAIFLDRDGVINFDKNYVHKVEDFEFIPGAIEGLQKLRDAGFKLFIITNQSGIGRGIYTEKDMLKLHDFMLAELEKHGITIDCIYYCPHRSDEGCDCRKPNPKFVLEAAKKFDLDLGASWFIGDRDVDVNCGKNAGVRTIMVGNTETPDCEPDFKEKDLLEAVGVVSNEQ